MTPRKILGRPAIACILSVVLTIVVLRAWHGGEQAASAQAAARGDVVRAELRPKVEELLTLYSQGKVDDMLQRMPVAPAENRDDFENLRRELIGLTGIAGRYLGFDIVQYQTLTERYHEVYVMAYFENKPVLFEFGFYKPGNAWQVQRFKVEPDLGPFLEANLSHRP